MGENITQNTNTQAENVTAAESAEQSEKLFTQDDVNRIVSERLTRDREKRTTQQVEDTKEQELDMRVQELNAREARLSCREYLTEKDYPIEILDVLDTSNAENFKAVVDRLYTLFGLVHNRARFTNGPTYGPDGRIKRFTEPKGPGFPQSDSIRDAFKP